MALGLVLLATACTRETPRKVALESAAAPVAPATTTAVAGATVIALATVARMPSATTSEAAKATAPSDCPEGMVLVEGEYCPDVEQKCLEWMDPPGSRYHEFRCAKYAPSVCKSKERKHLRFCIDRTERRENDSDLPRHYMSWTSSKKLCESEGGRLCKESEWVFACEGEEMRPYPYGWARDSAACNVDISENIGRPGRLVDHRAPAGGNPRCASPFGVQDLSGNLEEWVQADNGKKMGWKEVLKGSWWIPSRHACRQFQVGHNDVYNGAETGARCCKDAPASR